MTEKQKIILLTEVIENRLRKEKELEFYKKELEKLKDKMFWLQRDIDVTNIIIDMISEEKVADLVEAAQNKLLIGKKDAE